MELDDGRPRVSVIIPCFNQGRFLSDAVESALAQTHRPVEVIVVDDGSTDDTADVVQRYHQLTCIRQPNLGLAHARNAGLRQSAGQFVIFLDADDRLLPDAAAVGLTHLTTSPECAFVSGEHRYIGTDGTVTSQWTRPIPGVDHYAALLRGNYIGMIATVLFRREVFESVAPFDPRWAACEDYDLYLRIARVFPVCAHDTVVAEYRRHSSAMSNDPQRMLSASVAVLRQQRASVRDNAQNRQALRKGLRYWRRYYGTQVALRVREDLRVPGRRRDACRGLLQLARHSPIALGAVVGMKVSAD
jgi:glycosyltransferase involved in cell wall biosynthesis